jgi:hypothetical protein
MPTIVFKNEHAFSYDTSLSMCPDSVFLRSMYKRIEHDVWLHGHIRKNLKQWLVFLLQQKRAYKHPPVDDKFTK